MKNIRLNKLELLNFKGIRAFTLSAYGENVSVYGDNATGKTTLADAFYWLLFDKDSEGRTQFDIKTLDASGNAIHGLDHSVTGFLWIDGAEVELQKVYHEKWTKQRGSAEAVFTGHETEYYINGIPKSKGEYTSYIAGIMSEDIFKLLTNPLYFSATLDKKQRRKMLFDMFGDISNEEVIASDADFFGELGDLLRKYTVDELKTMTASNKRKCNDELQHIPNRIDTAVRLMADIGDDTTESITAKINDNRTESAKNRARLIEIEKGNTDTAVSAKRAESLRIFDESEKAKEITLRKELDECKKAETSSRYALSEAKETAEELKRIISTSESRISYINRDISAMEEQLATYRQMWQEENAREYNGSDICPVCGQELPSEKKDDARRAFNEAKAKRMEDINARGKRIAEKISQMKYDIEKANETKADAEAKACEVTENVTVLNGVYMTAANHLTAAKSALDDFISHNAEEREKLSASFENENAAVLCMEEVQTINSRLKELESDTAALLKRQGDIERNERTKIYIAELESRERELSSEYERLEKLDYTIGEFIRKKAEMLEHHINAAFTYATFKLFDTQINGGITETCEVMYKGVPYSALNNAGRINIGLDIINAFCRKYETTAPIFIDNAEAVTALFGTDSQQIRLYVSPLDKVLKTQKI